MSLTKALLLGAGVVGGAVGASVLTNNVLKRRDVAGVPTELAVAGALLLTGLSVGGALGSTLIAGAAGAVVAPARNVLEPKLASLLGGGAPAIAGYPYIVGELPRGAAMYALPPGASGQVAHNAAMSIAGLA